MNWEGETAEAAWRVIGYDRSYSEGERRAGFNTGARWQRDQLRTDEAVERLADELCAEEEGMTLAEHEANCELPVCGFRQSFLADARRNITSLLGEGS